MENKMNTKFVAAKFIYKCRRCNGIKDNTESGYASAHNHLQNAILQIRVDNQSPLPLIEVHDCGDGGFGLADLIGLDPIT